MSKDGGLFGDFPEAHLRLKVTDKSWQVARVDDGGHTVVSIFGVFCSVIMDLSPPAATRLQQILADPESSIGRDDRPFRMTTTRQMVLRTLLDHGGEMYGRQIADAAGVQPGSVYAILGALEDVGWLESREEDIDPGVERRPRRRYYWVPNDVEHQVRNALNETSST